MQNKSKHKCHNPAHLSYLISVPESSLTPVSDKYFSAINVDKYVLISGSYDDNKDIDALCNHLGYSLSQLNVGLVSGCGKAGLMVSKSLSENLSKNNLYDPERIIFYSRIKKRATDDSLPEGGTTKFYGKTPSEMREKMISKVKTVISVAGKDGTKEEEKIATQSNTPFIPLACSGGASLEIWHKYKQQNYKQSESAKQFDPVLFDQLNNPDNNKAVSAAIALLKSIPDYS